MARLEKLIDPALAARLVNAYYKGVDRPDGDPFTFSGAKFDTLARGGYRADAADEITYDDLVAVTMLNVEVPPHTALKLLNEAEGRAAASHLRGIPRLQKLASLDVEELHHDDHPAIQLWRLLRTGMGKATASKLMARKRPHLIPVWDSVIGRELGPIDDHWRRVHAIATNDAHTLAAIKRDAGIQSNTSLLRVLDVALWMRGAGAAQVKAATGIDLLATSKPKKKAKKAKKKR